MDILADVKNLKEQVSMVDLLARLGFHPLRRSGKEDIYLSMLRGSDTHPSFAVNDALGVWYDHGMGQGGNIIDFGLLYWKGLSFIDVVNKIKSTCDLPLVPLAPAHDKPPQRRHAVKVPHYRVETVKDLGNNPAITGYLQSRGIWNVAGDYLKEIYYFVENEKKERKYFFAAGWQNELGGWEVRNKNFKGCLGHKAISLLPGNTGKLRVFEGYFDFLSWKTENFLASDTVLILNTTALLTVAIELAKDFEDISTYFDHDQTGRAATKDFKNSLPQTQDRSGIYNGFNDYNDYLRSAPDKNKNNSFFR